MDEVRGFKGLWKLGAKGGFVIGGEAAAFGLLVCLPLTLVAELSGRETATGLTWTLYSAPLWLPVAIGDALRRWREWSEPWA